MTARPGAGGSVTAAPDASGARRAPVGASVGVEDEDDLPGSYVRKLAKDRYE